MKRNLLRSSCLLLACGIGGALLFTMPAMAYPPETLAEALTRSADTGRQRTPLLIIDAEGTHQDWENSAAQEKLGMLYEADDARPPLSAILEGYGRQIVSCSSVQMVAPLTRVVLNPVPGPAEEWAAIGRERAAKRLLTSLTPAQWAIASSPKGIGLDDLSKPEQKAWFQSLFPQPFILKQVTQAEQEAIEDDHSNPVVKNIAPQQIRLRIVRNMSWVHRSNKENGGYHVRGFTMPSGRQPGEKFWVQDSQPGQELKETYQDDLASIVRIKEPNKLKKSDLGFNTAPLLGARISLKGAGTVGDIVQRVAEKTGLEIYADRRLTAQKLTVRGPQDATVDAADVMKALCYAFAGAIRKVSDGENTVYILTNDQQGLMTPRLRLAEWADDVEALLSAEQDKFLETTRAGGFINGVGFNEKSPRIGAEAMARAEQDILSPEHYSNNNGYTRIAVSELTPEVQQAIRKTMEEGADLDTQNIFATFSVRTELIVPGYGTFSGPDLGHLNPMLQVRNPSNTSFPPEVTGGPVALPAALREFTALKVAPKSNEEIDRIVRWARSHGFKSLLIHTSLWDGNDAARLVHALEVGKANGIKIYPVLSLLKAPPLDESRKETAPNNLARTRNVFGETLRQYAYRRKDAPSAIRHQARGHVFRSEQDQDWLEPEAASVRKAVAERVKTFADTPGIAGLLLTDTSAPGYNLSDDFYNESSLGGHYGGYNEALRIALIRQENLDPVDVPPLANMGPHIDIPGGDFIPYFSTDWNLQQSMKLSAAYHKDLKTGIWTSEKPADNGLSNPASGWNALRREKNREWMRQIRRDAQLPTGLSVFWETAPEVFPEKWIAPWKEADVLPPAEPGKVSFLTLSLQASMTQDLIRMYLGPSLEKHMASLPTKPYNGIVIDTTAIGLDKALNLLNGLRTVE